MGTVTAHLFAGMYVFMLKEEWKSWSSLLNNIIAVSVSGISTIYTVAPKEVTVVTQLRIFCYTYNMFAVQRRKLVFRRLKNVAVNEQRSGLQGGIIHTSLTYSVILLGILIIYS